MKRKKLGEVLRDRGQISAEDLQHLFKEQEGKIVRLGELIFERNLVDKASLIKALEEVSRVAYMDCSGVLCEEEALQLIPKGMAVRLDILPVNVDRSRLVVVMAEPQNVDSINELRFTCGKDVSPRFGFRAEIQSAIALGVGAVGVFARAGVDPAASLRKGRRRSHCGNSSTGFIAAPEMASAAARLTSAKS